LTCYYSRIPEEEEEEESAVASRHNGDQKLKKILFWGKFGNEHFKIF